MGGFPEDLWWFSTSSTRIFLRIFIRFLDQKSELCPSWSCQVAMMESAYVSGKELANSRQEPWGPSGQSCCVNFVLLDGRLPEFPHGNFRLLNSDDTSSHQKECDIFTIQKKHSN